MMIEAQKQNSEQINFLEIPENELVFSFSRSSGPGGQNVNKVETKAIVKWAFGDSNILTPDQKLLITEKLASRINEAGELVVSSQSTRSQLQNRHDAIDKLNSLVQQALTPEKERLETKVPGQSKKQRREEKKRRSQIKQRRKSVDW